jgi:hypothetical protein
MFGGAGSAGRLPVLLRHKVVVCKTERGLAIDFQVRQLTYMRMMRVRKVVCVDRVYREVVGDGKRRHHLGHHPVVSG